MKKTRKPDVKVEHLCAACGALLKEAHLALFEMSDKSGPIFGVCPTGCDEHEQQAAFEDYLKRNAIWYENRS